MSRLADRNVLITGGGGGIGAASAILFAEEGARVAVADIDAVAARRVADKIGDGAVSFALDVGEEDQWRSAIARVVDAFGRLDVLMNCAGLFHAAALIDSGLDDFERVSRVNLRGTFLGCKHAVAHMKDRDPALPHASLINVSSTAGFVGTANTSLYTMSKGGVRLFSKAVAVEMGEAGYPIRCNSLHPGGTDTAMHHDVLKSRGVTKEEFDRDIAPLRNPLGRVALPQEIAMAALFLASDESSFMTGAELAVDGGYAAR